jgi:hypothetical protein
MSLESEELYARASFGKQAELFWSSPLGEYLQGRARECYTAAIRELKTCDPTDAKRVSRLQADVWKTEMFELWLSEAILDGLKSLDLIEGEDLDG